MALARVLLRETEVDAFARWASGKGYLRGESTHFEPLRLEGKKGVLVFHRCLGQHADQVSVKGKRGTRLVQEWRRTLEG